LAPRSSPAGRGLRAQVGDRLVDGQQDVDVGEGHGQGQRAGVVAVVNGDARGARRAVPAHAQPQRRRAGAQPRELGGRGGFRGGSETRPPPGAGVGGPGGAPLSPLRSPGT